MLGGSFVVGHYRLGKRAETSAGEQEELENLPFPTKLCYHEENEV
uniref:Uncharacterized protein n=1 Tax=Virgibacillus oceani TaxID=1479511 RepID=A0A917HQN1_9BACI|nr:hypothetical protein GCM10011398_35610 [Virgibacillus oceani]